VPGELGEACGAGVPCADPLECSALVGGTCEACGVPGDACFGLNNGTCCDDDGEGNDLVCDFIGECRRRQPHIGEPCGVGVACAEGYCDALIGGRCAESSGIPCDRLFPECPSGQVCDFVCGECRERRPTEGQVCGLDDFLGPQCADGLTCRLALPCSRCDPERGLGQRCFSSTNCAEGLQCWPFEQVCYPEGGEEIFPDALCLAIYSPERHLAASALNVAISYGAATSGAVGIGTSLEVGGVYGPDGRYGCYITRCTGGETSVGVSTGACLGLTVDYDSFSGISTVVSEGAGPGTGVQVSTSQVFDPAAGLDFPIGTADCFSLEASISPPLSGGVYQCDTIVDTVLGQLTTRVPSAVAGDADGNGRLAATDALLTLKVSVNAGLRCPRCVCDLNGSGSVTVTDALMTLQLAAGLTPPIPLANPACETPDVPVEINALELERARELLLHAHVQEQRAGME